MTKKYIIILFSILLVFIVAIFLSKKINTNLKLNIQDVALEYLTDKYNESFTFTKVIREFSGEGMQYRIVGHSNKYKEPFVMYMRENDLNKKSDIVNYGNKKYYVTDDYSNVVFQNIYKNKLYELLPKAVFIATTFETPYGNFTKEEYNKGYDYCVSIGNLYVYSYILVDGYGAKEEAENIIKSTFDPNLFKGHGFYIATGIASQKSFWENKFIEDYDRFDYVFSKYGFYDLIFFDIKKEKSSSMSYFFNHIINIFSYTIM